MILIQPSLSIPFFVWRIMHLIFYGLGVLNFIFAYGHLFYCTGMVDKVCVLVETIYDCGQCGESSPFYSLVVVHSLLLFGKVCNVMPTWQGETGVGERGISNRHQQETFGQGDAIDPNPVNPHSLREPDPGLDSLRSQLNHLKMLLEQLSRDKHNDINVIISFMNDLQRN